MPLLTPLSVCPVPGKFLPTQIIEEFTRLYQLSDTVYVAYQAMQKGLELS